jgi:catechol 2,3-dioxygenase-like lactoylglutathione lyase family enzyme
MRLLRPNALPFPVAGAQKMSDSRKPRLVGVNHVAIEVGNIDEALAWYGQIFDFTLRGRSERSAFIDMGDQFINMTLIHAARQGGPERRNLERRRVDRRTERRHIGFVVDDRTSVKARAEAAGAKMVDGPFLDFLDPWGNRIEVVEYANIQFTKASHVLRGMGLALAKNDNAKKELAEKGMAAE